MSPGTQETKRRRRAAPDPAPSEPLTAGCLVVVGAWLGACVLWFWSSRGCVPVALGIPAAVVIVAIAWHALNGLHLRRRVQSEWTSRGIRCLVIHSNSPAWDEHIRSNWLPRIGPRAVLLNWSHRSKWGRHDLRVKVFRHFCGSQRNFNPAVIVFQGLREPLVYRFFHAFGEARHGRTAYLDDLERRMFEALGDDPTA